MLGLIGDNGAGKSTLLKILCGFQPPDRGRILLNNEEVTFKSVDHARSLGIDAVYQDLALINELSVYHNMFLNREKVRWPLLNNRAMRKFAREHLDEIGVNIPSVQVPVARLSGGQRQAIAVARAVFETPRSCSWTSRWRPWAPRKAAMILDLVLDLKKRGDVSVIIIAHNYGQVFQVCDRVNLLQHGEITVDKYSKDTSVDELTELVVAEYRAALEGTPRGRSAPGAAWSPRANPPGMDRLDQQMRFVTEIGQLKGVLRQTMLAGLAGQPGGRTRPSIPGTWP